MRLLHGLLLLISHQLSFAQYSSPTLLSTAGGDNVIGELDINIAWSIGESVTLTLEQQQVILTCGFHQWDENCSGDLNFDGVMNIDDLLIMLSDIGCQNNCIADLNNDVFTGMGDLLIFLSIFGTSCYGNM